VSKGLSVDALALFEDLQVAIRWGQVLQALLKTMVIIALDEVADLGFETAGQIVFPQQNSVL
jgi:hypothetical protein